MRTQPGMFRPQLQSPGPCLRDRIAGKCQFSESLLILLFLHRLIKEVIFLTTQTGTPKAMPTILAIEGEIDGIAVRQFFTEETPVTLFAIEKLITVLAIFAVRTIDTITASEEQMTVIAVLALIAREDQIAVFHTPIEIPVIGILTGFRMKARNGNFAQQFSKLLEE